MATIREYYESDFGQYVRVRIRFPFKQESIEGNMFYDFASLISFLQFYIPGKANSIEYYIEFLSSIKYGQTQVNLDSLIVLPYIKTFQGELFIANKEDIEIKMKFFGDPEWTSRKDLHTSPRLFIYSETTFPENEIIFLKNKAKEFGHELQFRSEEYLKGRNRSEKPLAFISHDTRDKDDVARKIANNLGKRLCPVWYDEYSLKVGQNLRESIEKGLKECRKCILILSPNFIRNNGWTKTEFDSIFTREIIQKTKLVLPIWYNISKEDVFNYSPSLLNIVALDWSVLGEEKVCTELYKAIMP
jgi:hypothetical protein